MSKIFGKEIQLANQTYVDTSSLINVPNTTIIGRAQIPDLTKDLSALMGVNRVMTQQIVAVQNEFGPNGESIWTTPNDLLGQIRFIGQFQNFSDASGQRVNWPSVGNTTDAIEVTFYGTGLNLLFIAYTSGFDIRASVDGGSEGSNIFNSTYSSLLINRNYNINHVINVVSGLSPGMHTVKMRINGSSNSYSFYGFEFVNESTSLKVNSGSAYSGGSLQSNSAQLVDTYNSNFINSYGTAGAVGGRVLVYQKPDGTIGKDIQYVNAAQANLTSADHTNEEVARVYHWREFGNNASNDFPQLAQGGVGANAAFTLDDDSTALCGSSVRWNQTSGVQLESGLQLPANSGFMLFTFVGCGLDIIRTDDSNGGSDTYSVSVDGVSLGNLNSTGQQASRREKICSGLPYGSHTVKITRVSVATFTLGVRQFIVYQPKKPVLPAGAIELADYNILATLNTSAITTTGNSADNQQMPIGVLKKHPIREMTLNGTFTFNSVDTRIQDGQSFFTSTNGDFVEFTFFGTGFVTHFMRAGTNAVDWTMTIDGSLNASGVAITTGTASNLGSGSYRNLTSGGQDTGPVRISFTGLTLGIHKIRVTKTAGSDNFNFGGYDIITPIHSFKSNFPFDMQNTLTVGSQAISDNRKSLSTLSGQTLSKAWTQAVGVTSGPSTTSTQYVPIPELSCTIKATSGRIRVSFNMNAAGANTQAAIFVDGVKSSPDYFVQGGNVVDLAATLAVSVSPGTHKVEIMWLASSGTSSSNGTNRSLLVEEV